MADDYGAPLHVLWDLHEDFEEDQDPDPCDRQRLRRYDENRDWEAYKRRAAVRHQLSRREFFKLTGRLVYE